MLTTQYREEADRLAHRVAVVDRGTSSPKAHRSRVAGFGDPFRCGSRDADEHALAGCGGGARSVTVCVAGVFIRRLQKESLAGNTRGFQSLIVGNGRSRSRRLAVFQSRLSVDRPTARAV